MGQFFGDIFIPAHDQVGKLFLFLLQSKDLFFDGTASDEFVVKDMPGLPNPVSPVCGLVFDSWIPPGIVVDNCIGRSQIQTRAAGFKADQKEWDIRILKLFNWRQVKC